MAGLEAKPFWEGGAYLCEVRSAFEPPHPIFLWFSCFPGRFGSILEE